MKTRKGVEIGRIGEFPLSTGTHEFTKAQLARAVENAQTRNAPVIGIGHTDPRWKDLAASDGDPALGRVENLELQDDGELLIGDFVDMPDWFADALPTLFPRRSLEGTCEGDDLIIDSVKLLGTKRPGIHTLADIKDLVSDDGPVLVAAGADNNEHEFTILLASDGQIRASANIEELREAWQADHPSDYEADPPVWWCIEEIQVDPDQLIYRHEEKLWRQSWTVDQDGNFTFGDAVEVAKQYVDKVAASGPAAVYKPPVEGGHPSNEEVSSMDPKKIREALGLPEDATDEQVTASLAEQDNLNLQAVPEPEETPEAEVPAETPDGVEEPVQIAASVWEENQNRLAEVENELATRREADDKQRRDLKASAALQKGCITKAEEPGIRSWLDDNEEAATKFIDSLTPGRVPVDRPRGVAATSASGESDLLAATRRALRIPTQTEA